VLLEKLEERGTIKLGITSGYGAGKARRIYKIVHTKGREIRG